MTKPAKDKKVITLRKQFTIRIFIILFIVALVSSVSQLVMMQKIIEDQVNREADFISTSIQQGVIGTDLAASEIEHQIDYKMESYSKSIAEKLNSRPFEEISDKELIQIRDELGIAGITLFQRTENDLIGVKSTEPSEIGFKIGDFNPQASIALDKFMDGEIIEELKQSVSFVTNHTAILYITQSSSEDEVPKFYKYAYHHVPGTDYLIDPYIEASEIDQYIQKVGPEAWISEVRNMNKYVEEIAVLNPKVFADPSLEGKIYPPLKKVVNGQYELQSESDKELLVNMLEDRQQQSLLEVHHSNDIYKTFTPMDDGRVIYVALNYDQMKAPFHRQTIILILSGFISLVALVLLTTSFFNQIYANIQKIIAQILQLQNGDFTVRSSVKDKGELSRLSSSANQMASTLNRVLSETRNQANRTERFAYLLESEADNSVEKVYTLSIESTKMSREMMTDVEDFLEQVKEVLESRNDAKAKEVKNRIDIIHQLCKDSSTNTTEMTINLADLLRSLHSQSASLSEISKKLLRNMEEFKLSDEEF
ncbi:methyl-accepting chemotaxis protein [Gracilibacillus xinjiangensis]|uniref:histidine kinase n=1 Tax=Gracilibacillus xinjiangensis TaxID=1193282 RepID=A0ABV8WST0_9BACI